MKKIIALCITICMLFSLCGCNKKEDVISEASSPAFTPTNLEVAAMYDITGCSLTSLMTLNEQSKLKGNYIISLYQNDEQLKEALQTKGYDLMLTSLSAGLEFCSKPDGYSEILTLISCNIYAVSNVTLKSMADFKEKNVCVYGSNSVVLNLKCLLKNAGVSCNITTASDRYEFEEVISGGNCDIAVATEPYATEIKGYNKSFSNNLLLNDEWTRLGLAAKPYVSCIFGMRELFIADFKTCEVFLKEYEDSYTAMLQREASVINSIYDRGFSSSAENANVACKNSGFYIEDYNNAGKLLYEYAAVMKDIEGFNYPSAEITFK